MSAAPQDHPTPASVPPPSSNTKITEYSPTETALADLRDRYKGVVYDMTKQEDYTAAIKGRAELRKLRLNLEEKRKELKKPILERGRILDAEAERITGEIVSLEDPIDKQIKIDELNRENARKAKEAAEATRLQLIHDELAVVNGIPTGMVGKRSDEVAQCLTTLRARTFDAQEFADKWQEAKTRAIAALEQLLAGAVAMEQAAERDRIAKVQEEQRLAREREEFERHRAEQDRLAKEAQERIVAENRRLAEERAKAEAEDRRRRDAIEAEEKAFHERIEAEQRNAREQREREENEARARRQAEEQAAREKAEAEDRQRRAALAAEEERDRKVRAERAETERKEQERRDATEREQRLEREREEARLDAERRELERRKLEVEDAENMLTAFVTRFGHMDAYAAIVKAIEAHRTGKKKPAGKTEAAKS